MKNFLADFKAFAMKGNVLDMAIGVIIGGAFGKIVTSVVNDLLMPLLSLVIGGLNLAQLKVILVEASGDTPALVFAYGNFLQSLVDFLIIALSIFLFMRLAGRLFKKKEAEAPAAQPPKTELLLEEIRDLLKR